MCVGGGYPKPQCARAGPGVLTRALADSHQSSFPPRRDNDCRLVGGTKAWLGDFAQFQLFSLSRSHLHRVTHVKLTPTQPTPTYAMREIPQMIECYLHFWEIASHEPAIFVFLVGTSRDQLQGWTLGLVKMVAG